MNTALRIRSGAWTAFVVAFLTSVLVQRGADADPAAEKRDENRHLVEAEHTSLAGAAQASGSNVWTYGGRATWDVIVRQASYRLFLRVRSGYAADHTSGVKGKTAYRVLVDGRPVALRLVPGTVLYGSDESNWAWITGDVGELKQGLHTLVFSADWQFGRWDTFLLTSDMSYTPGKTPPFGQETPRDLSLLSVDQKKRFQGFTAWAGTVESNCPPTAQPAHVEPVKQLGLSACVNQHGAVVVNVTNWLERPMLLRASRDDLDRGKDALPALPGDSVTLRHAVPLPAPRKDQLADALPKLDGAGLVLLPAGETRQLWVSVNTTGLKAGQYSTRLKLQPLNAPGRCVPQWVDIDVTVADVVLPSRHPLDIFLCEYDIKRPGMRDDLSSHYVNWYHNCLIPHPASATADFRSLASALRREMDFPGARQVFFEHWHFRTDNSWKKPKNRKAWVDGIRRWARFVHKELGLGYDAFTLHIFDEVSGEGIDTFLAAREVVREADPRVRVTMTVTPQITLDDVRRLNRGVDVWCPHAELYENQPEVTAFLKSTRKPVVPYICAENKRFWPSQMYRAWAWRLYEQQASGMFIWTWLSRDAWQGRSWDGGMVFAGNGGVVPSRRWELLRMGLEDWLLLDMAKRAGHVEAVQRLVKQVVASRDAADLPRKARAELIELLAASKESRGGSKGDR